MRKNWKPSLPLLPEDERLYLNVPYANRGFARACHCGFDSTRKLWFTGCKNTFIDELIEVYGLNEEATTEKAKQLLNSRKQS